MNFIIVDLEATCWEGRREGQNEIIEIGAVRVDEHGKLVGEFQCFVKPLKQPQLSDFCKKLTSIRQEDVDNADLFNIAVEAFKNWINVSQSDYLLCSWGFYDRKQFESDCALWGLDTEWLNKHTSLKHQYGKIKQLRRNIGMKQALALEGIPLSGTHHRGIDDARNIAQIFIRNLGSWHF